jgi:hypothetical protein
MKLELSTDIAKNTQISNFIKICPVGAKQFHVGKTDRQTDRTTLIVPLHNFANVPKQHTIVVKFHTVRYGDSPYTAKET